MRECQNTGVGVSDEGAVGVAAPIEKVRRYLLLQHRQLHGIFRTILCTSIYLLHYACPTMSLCVSLDCSVDGVSTTVLLVRHILGRRYTII